jgi:hypothetical protein
MIDLQTSSNPRNEKEIGRRDEGEEKRENKTMRKERSNRSDEKSEYLSCLDIQTSCLGIFIDPSLDSSSSLISMILTKCTNNF